MPVVSTGGAAGDAFAPTDGTAGGAFSAAIFPRLARGVALPAFLGEAFLRGAGDFCGTLLIA
ncbi:hypothetical protein [Arthrobacter sp. CAN_A6]|uniref:hypothetical protein n=1 Tax=Arthrobacter sp. CAN_A6 TaxID=2787721 RepID=UPI0018CA748B